MKQKEILPKHPQKLFSLHPSICASFKPFQQFKWKFLRFSTSNPFRFQVIIKYRRRLISTNEILHRFFIAQENFSKRRKRTLIGISTSLFSHYPRITFHYFSELFFFFSLYATRKFFKRKKPKRENGKCECVCITLMIEEWFCRVGRKLKTYAASETSPNCFSASIVGVHFIHRVMQEFMSEQFQMFSFLLCDKFFF